MACPLSFKRTRVSVSRRKSLWLWLYKTLGKLALYQLSYTRNACSEQIVLISQSSLLVSRNP